MVSTGIDRAYRFLELLRGDRNHPVHWQLFPDSDKSGSPVQFYATVDEAWSEIQKRQQQGYGVYVTVNPTDGKGRKLENLTGFQWAFADIDGTDIPEFPLTPCFITSRDSTHAHVYWPIRGCLTVKQYNYIQKMIALWVGADEQTIDPVRVLRLPGSAHLKDPANPKYYEITTDNSDTVDFEYEIDEIIQAFQLPEEKQKKLDDWVQNRNALTSGSGFNDNELYRQKLIQYCQTTDPVGPKGTGRSYHLIRKVGYAYDLGIPLEEAQQIFWEHYNPRGNPPWCQTEQDKFFTYIERGYNYCQNEPGCRTASGVFGATEPVSEPVSGWDENAKLADSGKKKSEPAMPYEPARIDFIGYVTETEAAANRAAITNKSPVMDHSILFIGERYPSGNLVYHDKVFYRYNGVHWEELADDAVKAEINRTFSTWKFAPNKINNIFTTTSWNCHINHLERGQYISTGEQVDNAVIMRNGIVEIDKQTGSTSLKPHTNDLFDLNALEYDYDPSAQCPEFIEFINSQWPGDAEMHRQVQELYGLALINDTKHHLLPIMIGKSRSGKGVHAQILTKLVGQDNICSPALEGLIEDHTLNTMSSKKLALIPEANAVHAAIKDRVLNRLKSITSNDSIQYDRKYKDAANCSVWPLTIISANEMPDFADTSGALANRVWPFYFSRTFAGREDRGLAERLCKPESIAGIFNWALQGAVRVLQTGKVTFAERSRELVDDIRQDAFPLSDFIEDMCLLDPEAEVCRDQLHDMYLRHARATGVKTPMTVKRFSKQLESSFLPVNKVRSSRIGEDGKRPYLFTGLKLNPVAVEKYQPGFKPVSNVTEFPVKTG